MNNNNCLQIRMTEFSLKFRYVTIEDYFDIKGQGSNSSEKVNFSFFIDTNKKFISLEICFSKNHPFYNIRELPDEINRQIFSYHNKDFLNLQMKICYTEEYPFKPPIWEFLGVKHNISVPINLHDYYTDIIGYHNKINKKHWSPAINIHIDILDFFQKINHFDYMLKRENFESL